MRYWNNDSQVIRKKFGKFTSLQVYAYGDENDPQQNFRLSHLLPRVDATILLLGCLQ